MEINFSHLHSKASENCLVYNLYIKERAHQPDFESTMAFTGLIKRVTPLFKDVVKKTTIDSANQWEAIICLRGEFQLTITAFEPPRETKDVIGLQFLVKHHDASKESWKKMRRLLKYFLKEISSIFEEMQLPVVGCTTVYLSSLQHSLSGSAKPLLCREMLNEAIPVFGSSRSVNLAGHQTAEGQLWLVQRPGDIGLLSNAVYVGLYPPEKRDAFYAGYFELSRGKVNFFDIYVHKAAYQWFQIKSQTFIDFDQNVKALAADTRVILNNIQVFRLGDTQNSIEAIAVRMGQIMGQYAEYARAGLSVKFQKRNFEILYDPDKILPVRKNEIWDFHHATICDQSDGFELLLHRCDIIIDQTKTAVSLIEASQAKLSAERTGYLQVYVGIVAIALAYLQLFSNAMALDVLQSLHLAATKATLQNTSPWAILMARIIIFIFLLICSHIIHQLYTKGKTRAHISEFQKINF